MSGLPAVAPCHPYRVWPGSDPREGHADRRTTWRAGRPGWQTVCRARGPIASSGDGEAGLERRALYLTNTVKHFKYETRGRARLHKRANAAEQAACRQWLAAELAWVQPQLVVGLGTMAAQTLFGNAFRISTQRGQWRGMGTQARGLATWHPSAVLRIPHAERRHRVYLELVADLHEVALALATLTHETERRGKSAAPGVPGAAARVDRTGSGVLARRHRSAAASRR